MCADIYCSNSIIINILPALKVTRQSWQKSSVAIYRYSGWRWKKHFEVETMCAQGELSSSAVTSLSFLHIEFLALIFLFIDTMWTKVFFTLHPMIITQAKTQDRKMGWHDCCVTTRPRARVVPSFCSAFSPALTIVSTFQLYEFATLLQHCFHIFDPLPQLHKCFYTCLFKLKGQTTDFCACPLAHMKARVLYRGVTTKSH